MSKMNVPYVRYRFNKKPLSEYDFLMQRNKKNWDRVPQRREKVEELTMKRYGLNLQLQKAMRIPFSARNLEWVNCAMIPCLSLLLPLITCVLNGVSTY
jgi:ABC-type uncharacterized transport system involved in gliding motility auxiliary subunit